MAIIMDDKKYHGEGVVCPGCGEVKRFDRGNVCIIQHR